MGLIPYYYADDFYGRTGRRQDESKESNKHKTSLPRRHSNLTMLSRNHVRKSPGVPTRKASFSISPFRKC